MLRIIETYFYRSDGDVTIQDTIKSKANPPQSPFTKGEVFKIPPFVKGGQGRFAVKVASLQKC
ncbi:MAG: hypothetical protein HXX17_13255 [Geobacteraceae bacterium]|nr:hypothetical protein [Geobacteraceae bacterium]